MSKETGGTKLEVLQDFKWAHRGVDVIEYAKGDTIETDDDDLIEVATHDDNKWAAVAGEDSGSGENPPDGKKKAKGGAPENKDAASKIEENKATEA